MILLIAVAVGTLAAWGGLRDAISDARSTASRTRSTTRGTDRQLDWLGAFPRRSTDEARSERRGSCGCSTVVVARGDAASRRLIRRQRWDPSGEGSHRNIRGADERSGHTRLGQAAQKRPWTGDGRVRHRPADHARSSIFMIAYAGIGFERYSRVTNAARVGCQGRRGRPFRRQATRAIAAAGRGRRRAARPRRHRMDDVRPPDAPGATRDGHARATRCRHPDDQQHHRADHRHGQGDGARRMRRTRFRLLREERRPVDRALRDHASQR